MKKNGAGMPPIHLWVYNHSFHGIGDQVSFAIRAFRQHGYSVSLGRQPHPSSLNVIIEGLPTQSSRDVLLTFCRESRKRVAIIMTEHMDFQHGQIYFHGAPLGSRNDYMHSSTILTRMKHLLECLPYLRCFFVLGDLPELRNISTLVPGVDVRAIPFPSLAGGSDAEAAMSFDGAASDLVFTGAMTAYRARLLAILEAEGLSVSCPRRFVSRNRRNAINRSGKVIINIPQREGWQWLSLMRVVAGLQMCRATISLGTHDSSYIASCCTQLNIQEHDWVSRVKQSVDHWKSLYAGNLERYIAMIKEFELERPFPHDVFEYWSMTDRVGQS